MNRLRSIRTVSRRRTRRRANILLFVIFILGSLFAATVGFLAMTRIDRQVMVAAEREFESNAVIDTLAEDLMLSTVDSLLGQQQRVDLPGPDLMIGTADDVIDVRRRPYDGYFQPDSITGLPVNGDLLDAWAMVPGAHPLLSSIEPYDSRITGNAAYDMELWAVTDAERLWDNRSDATTTVQPTGGIGVHPLAQLRGVMRIRRDVEPNLPSNGYDVAQEAYEGPNVRRDATGSGVKDARLFDVALLNDGERDFAANGADGPSFNDDADCDGTYDPTLIDDPADVPTWSGLPTYTKAFEANDFHRTLLPCDDVDGNGVLDAGQRLPAGLRRQLAARMRDDDPTLVDDGRLFAALRVVQNGGMVNVRASHPTLTDNLMGLNSTDGQPLAAQLSLDTYAPGAHEQYLRRRYMLPPRSLPADLGITQDMIRYSPSGEPEDSDLYRVLHGALRVTANGAGPMWYPVPDEPGSPTGIFDNDVAARWFNPHMWNDAANSAPGVNGTHYNIRPLLTFHSTDDLLMRVVGNYWDGLSTGSTTDNLPPYQPDNANTPMDPSYQSPQSLGFVGYSALQYYPAVDPTVVTATPNPADPALPPTFVDGAVDVAVDVSFYRRMATGELVRPLQPLVPLELDPALPSANRPYRPVVNAQGEIADMRLGRMQFALHSIGHANNPTRRELATVQDYFTVMLRNVDRYAPSGPDGLPNTADDAVFLERDVHDVAAQLTANFIDFADFDSGFPGGADTAAGLTRGVHDLPTVVQSRSGQVFWGVESQPFITEVFYDGGTYAVELYNPSHVPLLLKHTAGAVGGYKLRVTGGGGGVTGPYPIGDREGSAQPMLIDAGGFAVVLNDGHGLGILPAPQGTLTDHPVDGPFTFNQNDVVELLRTVRRIDTNGDGTLDGDLDVVVDAFTVSHTSGPSSRQRDTASCGGWLAPIDIAGVDDAEVNHPQTLGLGNGNVDLAVALGWAPVHVVTDSNGFESAYPTTGSLLLLMRFAHRAAGALPEQPFNRVNQGTDTLRTLAAAIDNGHMPVFNQAQLARSGWLGEPGLQPMDGTTALTIPWGQLVFDYFTALPLTDHTFDPVAGLPGPAAPAHSQDPGFVKYMTYLRGNQPTVRNGGLTVEGRININAAPWRVLQGLPLWRAATLPIYRLNLVQDFSAAAPADRLFNWPTGAGADPLIDGNWRTLQAPQAALTPTTPPLGEAAFTTTRNDVDIDQLGLFKAFGIVAYREQREVDASGQYNVMVDMETLGDGMATQRRLRSERTRPLAWSYQRHTAGFLTVGELANIRNPGSWTDPAAPYYLRDVPPALQFDNGQTYGPGFDDDGDGINEQYVYRNYLNAVAPLVAIGDWVTVKGHTFSAYGTLRGAGRREAVDKKAVRFEMVFDRSNLLRSDNPDERPTIIYSHREPYQVSGAD